MDLQMMIDIFPLLMKGAGTTLQLMGLAAVLGIVLGTLVALGRLSDRKWLTWPLSFYVYVLRGTPVYVQLLIVAFGIPQVMDVRIDEFRAAVLTFGINSSAYVAEIIRGGIQSIDKGQMEAARSLGMSYAKAMWYVVLPQAFKRVIPPLVNEMIALVKETSVVSAIALVELTRSAALVASRTYKPFTPYVAAALIYLFMTSILALVSELLERRLRTSD